MEKILDRTKTGKNDAEKLPYVLGMLTSKRK